MLKITIELTESEAEKLNDVLSSFWDMGPSDSGWQSEELVAVADKVNEAIEKSKAP